MARKINMRLILTTCIAFALLELAISNKAYAEDVETKHGTHKDILHTEMLDLYTQAQKLYNAGKYQEAIEICRKIIAYYAEIPISEFSENTLLESSHSLAANCYVARKNLHLAETELRNIISLAKKGRIPMSAAVRAQLQISNMYYQTKDYLKALREFQVIVDNYTATAYTDYAKEKIRDINSIKVGELKGKVNIKKRSQKGGATITVFNGFVSSSIATKCDGSYTVPFFESTKGTFLSVAATKDGYLPQVRNISVTSEKIYEVDEMTLVPIEDPNSSVITGVCFKGIQGGKLRRHQGISSYDPGLEIVITGRKKKYNVKCSDQGHYLLVLPAGKYDLVTSRGSVEKEVILKEGKTIICNLSSGRIMLD